MSVCEMQCSAGLASTGFARWVVCIWGTGALLHTDNVMLA